jgi:hypothetical protein
LKISTVELSKRLGIPQPTASQSVKRGERVVVERKLKLMSGLISINEYPAPFSHEVKGLFLPRRSRIKRCCQD